MSKKFDLDAMSVDELWGWHEKIGQLLSIRLTSEKRALEKRLAQLGRENVSHPSTNVPRERRKYPRVYPKYRNPNEPSETWSGRGKQPRWLTAALKTGHKIEEFVITNAKQNARQQRV
jgi:DNA-binding protein H-NS